MSKEDLCKACAGTGCLNQIPYCPWCLRVAKNYAECAKCNCRPCKCGLHYYKKIQPLEEIKPSSSQKLLLLTRR